MFGTTAYYAKEAFVLLFMNGPKHDALSVGEADVPLSKPLSSAVKLLEESARLSNPDALFLLAELNFWGNYSHPRNYKRAFTKYQDLANLSGNATAQQRLGFYYATGLGNVVGRDQAKAQMYHTFAAEQGDIRSEMTLAFRAHAGIGTPQQQCDDAVEYYKRVADKVMTYSRSGPPGGLALSKDAIHLADDEGGVYGEGASHSSSGQNAHRGGPASDQNAALEDVLEYVDVMSRKGDLKATFSLGRLHYDGEKGIKRNYRTARRYFQIVARKYWDRENKVISEDAALGRLASKAAAYLGRLYLRGEGVEQDYARALRWFKLGLTTGEAFCQYEIGLMYLLGLGVRKDPVVAADYLKQAAMQDWPAAQSRLGRLFLDQGDLQTAYAYFDSAARRGHIEGMYYLAEINNIGLGGRDRLCGVAVSYYKIVAEKVEALHTELADANRLYEEGDHEGALIRYMMAAEQGYETAQANVAWLLDEKKSLLALDSIFPWMKGAALGTGGLLKDATLALLYWARSARQWNADSIVKMGDYYYFGIGLPSDKPELEKAIACYQDAADMHGSAQAMWNLGWMHENGVGAEQDFHLAKRYYDLALETAPEAYLPVKLALWKLRLRSRWNDWIGGDIKSMDYEDEDEKREHKTWSDWLANFLEDEHPYYHRDDDDDRGGPQIRHAGDEAYAWDDGTGIAGEEYYMDDIDGPVLETLVIFALAGALAWLIYFRQARQQEAQRQQGHAGAGAGDAEAVHRAQQAQQQGAGGFFPPPDDPNFNAWGAGGIGH